MRLFVMHVFVFLPLLVFGTVAPRITVAHAQHPIARETRLSDSVRVETNTHGVKLSLIVPHTTYPRDAVVQVLILLRNISSENVYTVNGSGSPCPASPLGVQVVTPAGAILPARPIPNVFVPCNPFGATPQPLPSGMGILVPAFVVLQSTGLRAEAWLRIGGATVAVYGRTVHLNLVAASHPTLRVEQKGGRIYAVFSPALRGHGQLIYADSYTCLHSSGGSVFTTHPHPTDGWSVTTSLRFQASCKVPRQWHVVAGYLNRPVATLGYKHPEG